MTRTLDKRLSNQASEIQMPSLKTQRADVYALLAKAGLGLVPFAGSLLSELVVTIIPNQKIERLVTFAEKLESRLSSAERFLLDSQLKNEELIGVLEEVISQATRATSDERREYLAAVVARGLTGEEIEHSETRRILALLSELNDAEIIMLRFYLVRTINGDKEFREKHKDIVLRYPPVIAAPKIEKDKYAITENYRIHLVSLGLLENEYRLDRETGQQEIDTFTHAPKVSSRRLTRMGKVFLEYIGLSDSENELG